MKRSKSPTVLFLILTSLWFVSFAFAEEVKPFEKQDNEHVYEILENWNANKGPWVYNSMSALVMQETMPERPAKLNKTTFELMSELPSTRKQRLLTAAEVALEQEREISGENQETYFWAEWMKLLRSTDCQVSHGRSNGDPHMTTFDGTRYDFQTAGEYMLTRSLRNNYEVHTRQVRHNEKISVNGAAVVNVNGDLVSVYAQDFPDDFTDKMFRLNGEVIDNPNQERLLPQGGVMRFENMRYVIFSPTGEQFHVKTRTFQGSRLLDIDLFVPTCGSDIEGLLGNADGDPETDLVVREPADGRPDGAPTVDRGFNAVFGAGRHDMAQRSRETARLNFISRDFGNQFIISPENSRFEVPMPDLTDDLRYPTVHLTLSDLTDEEIDEALEACRKAGVAEEDLMECAFDYGYVGLEPDLPATYVAPKDAPIPQAPGTTPAAETPNNTPNNTRVSRNIFRGIMIGTRAPRTSSPSRTPSSTSSPSRTPSSSPKRR